MLIKVLTQATVSKIAAGEVIENPSSVVKELIENSIDASATYITIKIEQGGRNLVEVTDNGCGIYKEDMELAFVQHATSKLNEEDITNIKHLGFRGEALASIAAVSRVTMVSRVPTAEHAWAISYESGVISKGCMPSSLTKGTRISVSDLFCKTPTRLKFLQNEKMENQHILEIVRVIAIPNHNVEFTLIIDDKTKLHYPSTTPKDRIANVLKIERDELDKLFDINFEVDGISISGCAVAPYITVRDALQIYTFVNQRAIRNNMLVNMIRHAYHRFMEKGKYPKAAVLIMLPAHEIDVNVHPNKLDIRFQNPKAVTSALLQGFEEALRPSLIQRYANHAYQENKNTTLNNSITPASNGEATSYSHHSDKIQPPKNVDNSEQNQEHIIDKKPVSVPNFIKPGSPNSREQNIDYFKDFLSSPHNKPAEDNLHEKPKNDFKNFELQYLQKNDIKELKKLPLGSAICQLDETYILSETETELIIVDQHAAHERIMYEQMMNNIFHHNKIVRQRLMIPETIDLENEYQADLLEDIKTELNKLGFVIEKIGMHKFAVVEKPSLLVNVTIHDLLHSCISLICTTDRIIPIEEKIHEICAMLSCHNSIRAGRVMNKHEMNGLLRKMESTHHADQCNHGRPSYKKISFSKIALMFNRT